MTNTTKTTTTSKNTLEPIFRTFENATRNRNGQNDSMYTKALQDLATSCVFSVLKRLANVGGYVEQNGKQPTTDSAKSINKIRQTLKSDIDYLNRLDYAMNNATEMSFDKDGNPVISVKDKDLYNASLDLIGKSLTGDGLDLVNIAIVKILDETSKTDTDKNFLETKYTIRRLKRKVYIKDVDSLGGYETVETTPIQEVYKAIRREVENNRKMQVFNFSYSYIESVLKDTESETETEIYQRLPKGCNLATPVVDVNGKVTAYTVDEQTVIDTDSIISRLNLTDKQNQVLKLRLRGYGYKAISTYLGTSVNATVKTVKQIQEKAIKNGFTPKEN